MADGHSWFGVSFVDKAQLFKPISSVGESDIYLARKWSPRPVKANVDDVTGTGPVTGL